MPLATNTFRMPGSCAHFLHELHQWAVIGAEQLADRWMDTRRALAFRFHFGSGATHLVHIGRCAADVAENAFEFRVGSDFLYFLENRFLRTRLNDPALMSSDRAEGAATKAASHQGHGILDHLKSRNRLLVGRMRPARVGKIVNAIHFLLRQWKGGWRGDHRLSIVKLNQRCGIKGVRVQVNVSGCFDEGALIRLDVLEGG